MSRGSKDNDTWGKGKVPIGRKSMTQADSLRENVGRSGEYRQQKTGTRERGQYKQKNRYLCIKRPIGWV